MWVLLGIDAATRSGLTIIKQNGEVHTSSFRSKTKKVKEEKLDLEYEAEVANKIGDHFIDAIYHHGVTHAAIEQVVLPFESGTKIDPRRRSKQNVYRMVAVNSAICRAIRKCEVPLLHPLPDHWRKEVLGFARTKGEGGIKAAVQAYCTEIGMDFKNHDQADSIGIALWLRATLGLGEIPRIGQFQLLGGKNG